MNTVLLYIDGVLAPHFHIEAGVGYVFDISEEEDAAWSLRPQRMDALEYEDGRLVRHYSGKPYLTVFPTGLGRFRRIYSFDAPRQEGA